MCTLLLILYVIYWNCNFIGTCNNFFTWCSLPVWSISRIRSPGSNPHMENISSLQIIEIKPLIFIFLFFWGGWVCTREYWMIYRGPDFLMIVWLGSSPTPFSPSPVSKLPLYFSLPVWRRQSLLTAEREKGGGGGVARSRIIRPRENPCSINHSILSLYCTIIYSTKWIRSAKKKKNNVPDP